MGVVVLVLGGCVVVVFGVRLVVGVLVVGCGG